MNLSPLNNLLLVLTLSLLTLGFQTQKGRKEIATEAGIIYYLEEDKKSIIALNAEGIIWEACIIKACGEPSIGEPEIRHVKLVDKKFEVAFGKHSFARVDMKTGKVECLGSD